MRVIARKERPHPGRPATDHRPPQAGGTPSGLLNLSLHDLDQNRIWCAVVALAVEITAWMQLLALTTHQARRWEPKRLRLRLRLFTIPAALARTGRRVLLHLGDKSPWAALVRDGVHRLRALAVPG